MISLQSSVTLRQNTSYELSAIDKENYYQLQGVSVYILVVDLSLEDSLEIFQTFKV